MVTEKASQYCCFYQRDGRFLIVDDKRNSEVCGNNKKRSIIDGWEQDGKKELVLLVDG